MIPDVELLLIREQRAHLPLARQVILYLDPFALFKDASRGSAQTRQRALSYNCTMRWLLLAYIRRWMVIGASFFAAFAPAEALAANAKIFLIPAAAFAVGGDIAVAITILISLVYVSLGAILD